ncbi:CehA/McbA family metallohydrolase [Candidatus Sumerlaeota bacterium]|nr:CehA/McbA family metallohydrolase [Candidatus Sumerlaeota bacterium]
MRYIGSPLAEADVESIYSAMELEDSAEATRAIQSILNTYCLIDVHINHESRIKVARGPAKAELVEQGWRSFLVRVHNEAGVTAKLEAGSRNALPVYEDRANLLSQADVNDRWLSVSMFDGRPLNLTLSGLNVEYRILQLYSRDSGKREGHFTFNVGQGTQDIGFRNDVYVLFDCLPAVEVTLGVIDHDGTPTTASFVFKDEQGRVYPYADKRLEPDFFFHDQVYRADGETILLPPGKYEVTYGRGPEYLPKRIEVEIAGKKKDRIEVKLERWIDPGSFGWFSGDHHIHAAGCLHYRSPTIGVPPEAMLRHLQGEALNIGIVLNWGPGWYYQKQFFTGEVNPISTSESIIRYDVEVSGFPSSHCGHLCLLGLTEDDYPGTEEKEEWPSWNLPILEWAKDGGAVVGVAHSGWGLDVFPERGLPNFKIPPMNGIGAQEYLVDVTHGAIDFISMVDTPYVWELNVWYHTLNCGFETKISGETDFPCIYGDRVGMGRSYVKLDGPLPEFDAWIQGIKDGRAYVSDGRSHLMDFTVEGIAPGGDEASRLELDRPGLVRVRVNAAAYLNETPEEIVPRQNSAWQLAQFSGPATKRFRIQELPYNEMPYWHLERARIGWSRYVPVELVVNGRPVAREEILADGKLRQVEFEIEIERSSWVAVRILPSSHTNPVHVLVDGEPIRASRQSAQWCLEAIDQVWEQKSPRIRKEELEAAEAAFDEARATYRRILDEAYDDTEPRAIAAGPQRFSFLEFALRPLRAFLLYLIDEMFGGWTG